ncbi:unnamed protein product [Durusdinium trenchii]|uniref:Uncharacterized protein n=1 Tax=Durusdinium trenchii TaxID=1381693 RepID=A0ABP0LWR9_9DINO
MACNAAVCRSELQSTVRWWAAPATRAKEQDTQFDMYRCSSISKAQILIFRGKAGSTEESTEERWLGAMIHTFCKVEADPFLQKVEMSIVGVRHAP